MKTIRALVGIAVAAACWSCGGERTPEDRLTDLSVEEIAQQYGKSVEAVVAGEQPTFTKTELSAALQKRWPASNEDFARIVRQSKDTGVVNIFVIAALQSGRSDERDELVKAGLYRKASSFAFGDESLSVSASTAQSYVETLQDAMDDEEIAAFLAGLIKAEPGYQKWMNRILGNLPRSRRYQVTQAMDLTKASTAH